MSEEKPNNVDCSTLSDLVLEGVDFIKVEEEKIKNGDYPNGKASALLEGLERFLSVLKKENGIVEKKDKVKKRRKIRNLSSTILRRRRKVRRIIRMRIRKVFSLKTDVK